MKPLELTIYPRSSGKRLTGSELAAEYWFDEAMANAAEADLETCREGDSNKVVNGIFDRMQRHRLRALIIHRFATLPHYDEATS